MKIEIENAATALADPDALTEQRCREHVVDLWRVKREAAEKLEAFHNPAAPRDGRRDRLARGEDLEAVKAAHENLKGEYDRVDAQHAAFLRMLTVCRKREAAAALPDHLTTLKKKADAVGKARAALERATAELGESYRQTAQAYTDAGIDGDTARASEKLVASVIDAANGAEFSPRGPLYHAAKTRPHRIAEQLRYAEPQGLVQVAAPWRDMARA